MTRQQRPRHAHQADGDCCRDDAGADPAQPPSLSGARGGHELFDQQPEPHADRHPQDRVGLGDVAQRRERTVQQVAQPDAQRTVQRCDVRDRQAGDPEHGSQEQGHPESTAVAHQADQAERRQYSRRWRPPRR